ncbi:MAG: hypothetical protein GY938_27035 [Ketobacter sp.]|nr:hypothetical protein [Ketobacter sp.]
MTTTKQKLYAQKLRAITKRFNRMESDTVKSALELLEQLRRDISVELLADGNTEYNTRRLQILKENIGELVTGFESQMLKLTGESVKATHVLGGASVIDTATAAGIRGLFFKPTPSQVNILVDFSADLITNITQDMLKSINSSLTRGVLGQKNTLDVMKEITDILGTRAGKDLVKGVAGRAEKIYRTELGRVFELSAESQRQIAKELEPDLQKGWVATGDSRTRETHLAAHGQIVGVDDAFVVGGEELHHPKDPGGSAKNTIYCRCTTVTIWPEIGVIETPQDRRIKREQAKRELAT